MYLRQTLEISARSYKKDEREETFNYINNINSLTFTNFRSAVGKPKDVVGKNLVMHLIDDNIYLSVKFTSWSEGQKGGFAYDRSTQ